VTPDPNPGIVVGDTFIVCPFTGPPVLKGPP
jgi:hypothetical protein